MYLAQALKSIDEILKKSHEMCYFEKMRTKFQKKYFFIALFFLTLFNSGMALCQQSFSYSVPTQIDTSGWKAYADNLKTCTAGDFNVNNPITNDPIQFSIIGLKDDKCEVMMKMPDSGSYPSQRAVYNCQFEQSDISTLAQRYELLTKGSVINSEGPGIEIMNKSCKKTGIENNGNFVPIPATPTTPTTPTTSTTPSVPSAPSIPATPNGENK